jgi:hypothetical protein
MPLHFPQELLTHAATFVPHKATNTSRPDQASLTLGSAGSLSSLKRPLSRGSSLFRVTRPSASFQIIDKFLAGFFLHK